MGDEKGKKKGGFLKRCFISLVVLFVAAYGGWFAYAKATGNPDC